MNPPRRNFLLALFLFLAWVGGLAWMASTSGERPQAKPAPVDTPR